MNQEILIPELVSEMIEKHNCHSIILYGSRNENTHNANSDIDIACFTENGEAYTDCRLRGELFLDAWIYPEQEVSNIENFLALINGRVLIQKDNFANDLLEKVTECFKEGPKKLKDSERKLRITWCNKTLIRTDRGDSEGDYRRLWLINDLLPMYFELRDLWYRGPKVSLAWLKENNHEHYKLFELIFANPKRKDYLEKVVGMVTQQI